MTLTARFPPLTQRISDEAAERAQINPNGPTLRRYTPVKVPSSRHASGE